MLTRDESAEVFSTYPEENEQIGRNLLASFNLTSKVVCLSPDAAGTRPA